MLITKGFPLIVLCLSGTSAATLSHNSTGVNATTRPAAASTVTTQPSPETARTANRTTIHKQSESSAPTVKVLFPAHTQWISPGVEAIAVPTSDDSVNVLVIKLETEVVLTAAGLILLIFLSTIMCIIIRRKRKPSGTTNPCRAVPPASSGNSVVYENSGSHSRQVSWLTPNEESVVEQRTPESPEVTEAATAAAAVLRRHSRLSAAPLSPPLPQQPGLSTDSDDSDYEVVPPAPQAQNDYDDVVEETDKRRPPFRDRIETEEGYFRERLEALSRPKKYRKRNQSDCEGYGNGSPKFDIQLRSKPKTFICLQSLAEKMIPEQWRVVGRFLEPRPFEGSDINGFEKEATTEIGRAVAMLEAWGNEHGEEATLFRLLLAIYKAKLLGKFEDVIGPDLCRHFRNELVGSKVIDV